MGGGKGVNIPEVPQSQGFIPSPFDLCFRRFIAHRPNGLDDALYGCVKWSANADPFNMLRPQHHGFLRRCISAFTEINGVIAHAAIWRCLAITKSESVGTSIRRRVLGFTGFLVRMAISRLPHSGFVFENRLRPGERGWISPSALYFDTSSMVTGAGRDDRLRFVFHKLIYVGVIASTAI